MTQSRPESFTPLTERQYLLLSLPGQGEVVAGGPYGLDDNAAIDMELEMIHYLSMNLWEEEIEFRYLHIAPDGTPTIGEFNEEYINGLRETVWLENGEDEQW